MWTVISLNIWEREKKYFLDICCAYTCVYVWKIKSILKKRCKLISEKRNPKLWDEQVDSTGDPLVIVVAIQSGTIEKWIEKQRMCL